MFLHGLPTTEPVPVVQEAESPLEALADLVDTKLAGWAREHILPVQGYIGREPLRDFLGAEPAR
jgi:hypothetical protein